MSQVQQVKNKMNRPVVVMSPTSVLRDIIFLQNKFREFYWELNSSPLWKKYLWPSITIHFLCDDYFKIYNMKIFPMEHHGKYIINIGQECIYKKEIKFLVYEKKMVYTCQYRLNELTTLYRFEWKAYYRLLSLPLKFLLPLYEEYTVMILYTVFRYVYQDMNVSSLIICTCKEKTFSSCFS